MSLPITDLTSAVLGDLEQPVVVDELTCAFLCVDIVGMLVCRLCQMWMIISRVCRHVCVTDRRMDSDIVTAWQPCPFKSCTKYRKGTFVTHNRKGRLWVPVLRTVCVLE